MTSYSFFHLILAAFGLGLLIFIHEFGHYWMALRKGMEVEVFSIGFGKPFFSWMHKGVKWQFCYLPFGGYVRIAGMEKKGRLEPYEIPNGFYGKKPWARIQVALAGPIVNIAFGFLIFCLLFALGGRTKSFSEYTHLIGWVDQKSKLYESELRPGDLISELNHRPFKGFNDFLYASVLDPQGIEIQGTQINYWEGTKQPFTYHVEKEAGVEGIERAAAMMQLISPANYLIFLQNMQGSLPEGSPMQESGIEKGDRLIWVDGELIFSKKQLISVVNDGRALLTVKRGDRSFLSRVPRIKVSDLKMDGKQKGELADWQHASSMKGKLTDLYFIPYDLSPTGVVEKELSYFNEQASEQTAEEVKRMHSSVNLIPGDHIIAVDGTPVTSGEALFSYLQTHKVQLVVRKQDAMKPVSWKLADAAFEKGIEIEALCQIVNTIGTDHLVTRAGSFALLKPITPKPLSEFPLPESMRTRLANEFLSQKKALEEIEDPQQKAEALRILEENQKKLMLGIVFQDLPVRYNPNPWTQIVGVVSEVGKTLKALVTGYLSPKWLAGPVGIVQVMHQNWMTGFKEALFWIGVISVNLGLLNLLPIPVLDGGHICFSIWEKITGRPLSSKTMERLVLPFIVLLVSFFIYVTYHDIIRVAGRFFQH